jgi:DNA-binding NtrC family response regulator
MIIFIDDEPHYIRPYTQAFVLQGFDVKVINNVDEAWKVIESSKKNVLAIIIDIMMPPGKLLESESTKQGLRTGEVFIEKLKTLDEGIPVVVLTNAEKADLGNISHRNFLIFQKKDISPWGLVDKISEMKRKRF